MSQPRPCGVSNRTIAVSLSLFLAAVVATAWFLPADYANVPHLTLKLEHLRAEPPYDVIFLGSSLTYRGLAPRVFDRETERLGRPLRSFNAGILGMRVVESTALLESIVARAETRPRWVMIEATGFVEEFAAENVTKPRGVYWHDLESTRLAIDSLHAMPGDRSRNETASVAGRHLRAFALRSLRIGTQSSHLTRWMGGDALRPRGDLSRFGFQPLTEKLPPPHSPLERRRQEFVSRTGEFRKRVEQRTANPGQYQSQDMSAALAHQLIVLERVATIARRYGVDIIYFVPPVVEPHGTLVAHMRQRDLRPVLDFSRVDQYPRLFEPAERFDWTHLNFKGARRFSRTAARHVIHVMNAREASP